MPEMNSQKMVRIQCRGIIDEQLALMTCEHEWKRNKLGGFICRHCGYHTGTYGDLYAQVEKEFEHAVQKKRLKKFKRMIDGKNDDR